MKQRIVGFILAFVLVTSSLSFVPMVNASGSSTQIEYAASYVDPYIGIQYRWVCYTTPWLTSNLQWVNAARVSYTVYDPPGPEFRTLYRNGVVQNAWQWFCPQR